MSLSIFTLTLPHCSPRPPLQDDSLLKGRIQLLETPANAILITENSQVRTTCVHSGMQCSVPLPGKAMCWRIAAGTVRTSGHTKRVVVLCIVCV